jgi:adenylylsulfate kinase
MSSPPSTPARVDQPPGGHVFWLFGLSGAGKSTMAGMLAEHLRRSQHRGVLLLDGDRLRRGLSAGLGFSEGDRTENLRRAAEVARLGIESGLVVVAAFITPLESQRQSVREIVGVGALSLVWVNAPLDVCRSRDVKGLYARAAAGSMRDLTGVSAAFENPAQPDLELETGRQQISESAARLAAFVGRKLAALPPA